jgi:N-acyl-D-aspartate/D-glutamate deacylase
MLGLDLSCHPLMTLPSYRAIADLPLAERVRIMRDPAYKAKMLAEEPVVSPVALNNKLIKWTPGMCVLGEEPDYAPSDDKRIGEMAKKAGVDPLSIAYDLLLEQDGHAILTLPVTNFSYGNLDVVREMLNHPDTILGLGDGGAHYGLICDAAYPTHLLTYWVRDAAKGEGFSLEWAINALSRQTAEAVGLLDRGLVAEGLKADLNIIDLGRMKLHSPRTIYNLPAGGRRLQQKADGYDVIIVAGEVTYRDGEPTGALPGRLVRGPGYRPERRAAA